MNEYDPRRFRDAWIDVLVWAVLLGAAFGLFLYMRQVDLAESQVESLEAPQ